MQINIKIICEIVQIVIIGLGQSPITNHWSMTDNTGVDSDDHTPPSSLSARAAGHKKTPTRGETVLVRVNQMLFGLFSVNTSLGLCL